MFLGQEKEHKDIVKFDGLLTSHYNRKNVEKKENEKLVFALNKFRIILVFSVSSWTKWVCNSKFSLHEWKHMKGPVIFAVKCTT